MVYVIVKGEPAILIESSSEKSNSIIEEFKSAVMKNAKEQRLKVRILYLKLKSSFDIISIFNKRFAKTKHLIEKFVTSLINITIT